MSQNKSWKITMRKYLMTRISCWKIISGKRAIRQVKMTMVSGTLTMTFQICWRSTIVTIRQLRMRMKPSQMDMFNLARRPATKCSSNFNTMKMMIISTRKIKLNFNKTLNLKTTEI